MATVLIHQLIEIEAAAEHAAVELTLRNMRTGLRWQVAERLMHGRGGDLGLLEGANPVAWLARPPHGYAGEYTETDRFPRSGGSWYFDGARREIAYVPRHAWRVGFLAGTARERRWHALALKSSVGPAVSAAVAGLVLAEVAPAQ